MVGEISKVALLGDEVELMSNVVLFCELIFWYVELRPDDDLGPPGGDGAIGEKQNIKSG